MKNINYNYTPKSMELGTQETIYKKIFNLTKEPLDLCLHKNLISQKQHKAGIIYRNLFVTIYGLPYACGYDLTRIKGRNLKEIDAAKLKEIEVQYSNITDSLIKNNYKDIISDICIFNMQPLFVNLPRAKRYLSKDFLHFKDAFNYFETLIS